MARHEDKHDTKTDVTSCDQAWILLCVESNS